MLRADLAARGNLVLMAVMCKGGICNYMCIV